MRYEIWVPKRRGSDVRVEEVDASGARGFTFEARLRAEPLAFLIFLGVKDPTRARAPHRQ